MCHLLIRVVTWMNLNTISVAKQMNHIAWELAKSEWIDQLTDEGELLTFDKGSNYYHLFEIKSFIEKYEFN